MAITMETDWGARGAQLTGAQVQAFIKEQLKALQQKDGELQKAIDAIGPTPEGQALQNELDTVKTKITELEKQLQAANTPSDWLETNKQSSKYIKNKPEIPTLASKPDGTVKSYVNADGTTVNFKIGDFIRYKNTDGKYVFYQVNDISADGTISWGEAGSGGEVDLSEKITISLTSNQAQPDASLNGATVTVRGTDGHTYFTGAWNGQPIHTKIPAMTEYRVSVSEVDGYTTPVAQKYTSVIQGSRNVVLMYNCCILTVNIIGVDAATLEATVTYGTKSKKVRHAGTVKVPYSTPVTVTCPDVTGHAKPQPQTFTPSQSSHIISMKYIASALALTITTNQSAHDDVSGVKATVQYGTNSIQVSNGQTVPLPAGQQITIVFPEVEGYRKPANIVFTHNGGLAEHTGTYQAELVTVSLTATNGDNLHGQTVTINNKQHVWNGVEISQKVPFGTGYKVSVNEKKMYITPNEQSFTANRATRRVTMQYVYNPIKKGYYILDDTVNDPATKITATPEVTEVITWIRQNSHRVLAKKKAEGVCKVIKLHDNDTTKYFDGTAAPITSKNYDVMMMMPEFWYAAESAGTDKWKIWFADDNPNDGKKWHKWDHGHLIGVYEAALAGSVIYSISGEESSQYRSQSSFKQYARAKGKGYTIIDWQAHCIMAFLFYGYYKNTNCQNICGSGTGVTYERTGQTNLIGMTDTTTSNGNLKSINFWGLENWWGNKLEWVDNVVAVPGSWEITENNSEVRVINNIPSSSGYISKLIVGENLDLAPKEGRGSDTTGYCDFHYASESSGNGVARSGYSYSSDMTCGVAYAYAFEGPAPTGAAFGTRLAFNGVIEEAASVADFLA